MLQEMASVKRLTQMGPDVTDAAMNTHNPRMQWELDEVV